MKNPLTPAGIEPATVRFVARHLNHCAAVLQSECHSTIDIITPPHHRVFRSTSLSYTILVHLAYISLPPHFTLHKSARHTLRPMYNTKSHPFHHSWARDRLCYYAFMPLRSTQHTRMGQFPFHSYHCQTLYQVLPRRCRSTVCTSHGIVIIGSQDSSQRWSGDVWPDTPSSVSVSESRCNLAQCMLHFL